MIRTLMHEQDPDAEEVFSYGMPCYKGKHIFAWMIASKKDITFSFTYGTEFEDRYGLLKGAGKHARHVKMKSLASVNKEALDCYIKQALAHDEK